jgi:competence protein ComGF
MLESAGLKELMIHTIKKGVCPIWRGNLAIQFSVNSYLLDEVKLHIGYLVLR